MFNWYSTDTPPLEAGIYLVTTANNKVRIDRYDGEHWGLCKPRHEIRKRHQGRYRLHRAWGHLPRPYKGGN